MWPCSTQTPGLVGMAAGAHGWRAGVLLLETLLAVADTSSDHLE